MTYINHDFASKTWLQERDREQRFVNWIAVAVVLIVLACLT